MPKKVTWIHKEYPLAAWVPLFLSFLAILFIWPFAVLRGHVLQELWRWFVVPVFGLPLLSKAQAYGLGVLVGYATLDLHALRVDHTHNQLGEFLRTTIGGLLAPLSYWLAGYVIVRFLL